MKTKISFLRLFILLGIITVAGLLYFNIGHIVSKSVGKEKVKEKTLVCLLCGCHPHASI